MSAIVQPSHYTQGILPGECINYVKYLDFCRGNVIKYLWRYENKNGIEDEEKALQYVKYIISTPDVICDNIPSDVREKFNAMCRSIMMASSRGEKKYDYVMCIYNLMNIQKDSIVLTATLCRNVLEKHIGNR